MATGLPPKSLLRRNPRGVIVALALATLGLAVFYTLGSAMGLLPRLELLQAVMPFLRGLLVLAFLIVAFVSWFVAPERTSAVRQQRSKPATAPKLSTSENNGAIHF